MPLTAGARLGPYEILAAIGAGGMGEVYRARDPRLARQVAMKVLPAAFSSDADRLRRFEQEARAAAALNHPNILAVYDIGTDADRPYIVSELLDGKSLRDEMRSDLAIRRAIEHGIQIARGLAAAHEKGIVHRDLKPENVFVTSDGHVKILDFGLAKLGEVDAAAASHLPTMPVGTEPGLMVGTMGYMAPEQVRGQRVDHRADIFAFGAILYEMLSGRRAFQGATTADTISAILDKDPPDLAAVERHIPLALARIVDRCFAKNPSTRFQSATDLVFALEGVSPESGIVAPVVGGRAGRTRERLAWALFGVASIAALSMAALVNLARPASEAPSFRATILPPPDASITERGAPQGLGSPARKLAISPDGTRLAFTAAGKDGIIWLWMRRLDSLTAQRLEGTQGAVYPFWSPDSKFIGFFAEGPPRRSKLMKIDTSGGPPKTLCELSGPNSTGGTWSRDGVILYGLWASPEGEIRKVSAAGGTTSPVTRLDTNAGETRHWTPYFLPDGRHFLYLASGAKGSGNPFEPNGLYVGTIDSGDRKLLVAGGSAAKYAQERILFLRGGTLMAQPFDARKLEFSGEAVPVAENVLVGGPTGASGAFAVSDNGILAYQTGSDAPSQLTWFDRTGKQIGVLGDPGFLGELSLSPDGSRAAVTDSYFFSQNADLWLYDVARGIRTRFTSEAAVEGGGIWSPDSQRLVFYASRKNPADFDLYVRPASGQGAEELLFAGPQMEAAESWSPDGRFLAYANQPVSAAAAAPPSNSDLWVLPLSGDDRKPIPFLQTSFGESQPRFSPDGRWIAFVSNETRRSEVYVAPFPGPGGKVPISTTGGTQPRWRRDGKEIFYVAGGTRLMAATVNGASDRFEVGAAHQLFTIRPRGGLGAAYDVSADGQRFLVNALLDVPEQPVTLVVNWMAGLKK